VNSSSNSFLKKYDLSFFGLACACFLFGILNLYSVTQSAIEGPLVGLYKKQISWFLFSMTVGVGVSFIRPKSFFQSSYLLYAINIILLIAVLLLGTKIMGARRWLDLGLIKLQPSELMKLSSVLALARWYCQYNPEQELEIKDIIIPFLLIMFPVLLIVVEPDLGTGLIILLIFFAITFFRRLKFKSIFIIFLLGLLSCSLVYRFGLREYQRQRIITFIDPWEDARGHGYNAIQSEIAIGSGQLIGKGYMKSSQASLNYLPENHTDFVFSVYNEEHGLLGSIALMGVYVIFFLRFIWLSTVVSNFYDSIVSIGLMSILFWHTFINMAMVTGLLPIVGITLPFISYGGSSLLTFGICCGMATSISNARNLF
jgi:rod shape determining protein RodA